MARGDATFSRLDVDIWTTRGMLSLKAGGKLWYLMAWTVAVRERKSFLDVDYVHKLAGLFIGCVRKSSRLYLENILDAGLGKLTEDNHLYVYGVKDCHEKLNWRDDGLFSPQSPLYREDTDPRLPQDPDPTRQDETKQEKTREDKNETTKRKDAGRSLKDKGNGKDKTPEKTGKKDPVQIGETIAGLLDQTLKDSKRTRTDLMNEIMINLKLPDREKEAVMKVINKHEGSLDIVADAMVCVVDGMARHREGTGAIVRSPMALLNFHVKRIDHDRGEM